MTAPKSPQLPPVQQFGDAVMVTGQGVIDLVYLIGKGIAGAKRDGYPTARFEEYKRIFVRAYESGDPEGMSRTRLGDVATGPIVRKSLCDEPETIGTAEAASISGYSRRHCQRLARNSGLGRPVGRVLLLDRAGFIAYLAARQKDYDDDRPAAA
jgi:hypothetical protein